MAHSIQHFLILAACTAGVTVSQQIKRDSTTSTVLSGCVATVDFKEPWTNLSTECRESFEMFLPSQENIVRFLGQFEDPTLQQQAQQALKDTFVSMVQQDDSVLTYGSYSETESTSQIPDSIPSELRYEILQQMLAAQSEPFRAPPNLRTRLQGYRNLLIKQGNYAAAYWIDRLLTLPGPPEAVTMIRRHENDGRRV